MKPTRTRYQASGFLFMLAAVTYLDRGCISTLAPQIFRDLHLSKLEMSFVFSAFAVAYAGFEIFSAWWGEKIGARRVLARIVIWWSAFTMATAGAWNYSSLLVIRFLFGGCIGGIWSGAWYRWFRDEPRDHRRVNQAEALLIESERQIGRDAHHGRSEEHTS